METKLTKEAFMKKAMHDRGLEAEPSRTEIIAKARKAERPLMDYLYDRKSKNMRKNYCW